MKKHNKNERRYKSLEEYDKKLNKVRRKYNKKINAEDGIEPYQVEVRYGNVEKALRVLERELKKDRVFESLKEKRRFKKPSQVKNEKNQRIKKRQAKENKLRKELEKLDN